MKRFKKVFVEITNACNLNCSYCSTWERKTEFISPESFQHLLTEIAPFSDYVYLHVKGEPFLHPELPTLLKQCHDKNIQVNITTNGTLINNVKETLLSEPALRQINFSLHSFDLTQSSQNKRQSVLDILSFTKEALAKTRIYISLRLWNLNKNRSPEEIEKNKPIFSLLETELNLPYKIEDKLIDGSSIKLFDHLYLNFDNEFRWPSLADEEIGDHGFCHALRDQVGILVDGTVVPCCLDGDGVVNLGNVYRQSLESIVDSERARKIYEGFSDNKAVEPLCRKCSFKERF